MRVRMININSDGSDNPGPVYKILEIQKDGFYIRMESKIQVHTAWVLPYRSIQDEICRLEIIN